MSERLEIARLELQSCLDSAKSQAERNRLGQFATPPKLATGIVVEAASLLPPRSTIRFLDPGFGTGSFYSAILNSAFAARLAVAEGFEIDPHYGEDARKLWSGTSLCLRLADFTKASPPADAECFDLLICNPPYVRHHHLNRLQKEHLQAAAARHTGIRVNGLSGLYCYFMVLSQAWMARNGIAAWLVPSEFMDVNYGTRLKQFLLENVELIRIHRFASKDVQFDDAFVSSAVVFFRNKKPSGEHHVDFTFGGSLAAPEMNATISVDRLRRLPKWTSLPQREPLFEPHERGTLADLFHIKRGLATGCNEFFVLAPERAAELGIPREFLKPILPSPRNLEVAEISADRRGDPQIASKRFLLDCRLPEDELQAGYPSLWAYLLSGMNAGVDQRYLCRHRKPWYSQEQRPPAPFLCTYMGRPTRTREIPFRFILNHSQATAANVYLLLYPKSSLAAVLQAKPEIGKAVWKALSSITAEMLTGEGRIYGGGLHKMEPKELANVPADIVLRALPKECEPTRQARLFA